jgi:hypothetical protein
VRSGSVEIELAVPAEDAWAAITAPGLREWYYRLTPDGDFADGAHIRWVDLHGGLAEESDVTEVKPPEHLSLQTRFVFAPNFAAEAPHRTDWDVTPLVSGCRVTMSWQAGDVVAAMLESEADLQLRGLRLAVDPVARAELARLNTIGELHVVDVTPDRVADYQAFFDHDAFADFPAWQACYCMETHRDAEQRGVGRPHRRRQPPRHVGDARRAKCDRIARVRRRQARRVVQLRRDDAPRGGHAPVRARSRRP